VREETVVDFEVECGTGTIAPRQLRATTAA
jgi:hypothetical protein